MKSLRTTLLLTWCAAFLFGCASTPESADQGTTGDKATVADTPANESEIVTPFVAAPPPPAKPFAIETLYSLLVAEFAGNRERYDIALGNYIQEAHRTRDPGITARATRIARYLDAHPAALDTSLLWIELEPNNPEALFIATSELAQAGRLQESFTYSERLQRLGSTSVFVPIAARAGQATDTQREQLSNDFDRLLVDYPDDAELLVGKAMLLQQENQPEQALTVVEKALSIDDQDIQAAILEARLLFQLQRPEDAMKRLVSLLQQNPDNQRLRLQYARLLSSIDMAEAQKQFEILVQQSPNDPDLLYSLALVAAERNESTLAKQTFERLLETGEYADSAHFYLGRIAEKDEDLTAALEHYQAVEKGQDFLPALDRNIDILIRRGDVDQAQTKMADMRQRFPDDKSRFYLMEAQVLSRHQYIDKSEALLTEALTLSPTNADLLYMRAMLHEQQERLDLAESDLRTIIKYQPNNATALNALGYSLANRTGRYDEAYDLIKQALEISPNDPAIMDSMGWVQYRLGNYSEAVLRLREAYKLFPDHEVAAHLGEALWVSGDKDGARSVWTQGLEQNPDSDLIPEAMNRLNAKPE